MKLVNLMEEYLQQIKYSIKLRTYIGYVNTNKQYISNILENLDLESTTNKNINDIFIQKYCSNKDLSTSTLKLIKNQINRCLNFGERMGLISSLKINIPLKSHLNKINSLTDDETIKLEQYLIANRKIYNYGILISLQTGLRIGELLALKWQDIDFEHNIMKVSTTATDLAFEHKMLHIEDSTKTESSNREIPLTKDVKILLKELKAFQQNKSHYVISRSSGKRIQIRAYQESFYRILKKLNIKHYGFHSLRHTFATRCYKHGMDIKTLSELLGHSTPAITLKVYVHTNIDIKKEALNKVNKKIRQNIA